MKKDLLDTNNIFISNKSESPVCMSKIIECKNNTSATYITQSENEMQSSVKLKNVQIIEKDCHTENMQSHLNNESKIVNQQSERSSSTFNYEVENKYSLTKDESK